MSYKASTTKNTSFAKQMLRGVNRKCKGIKKLETCKTFINNFSRNTQLLRLENSII